MRILFVANPYSVHIVRWISQLAETGWTIDVFDPENHLIHEELDGVVVHTGWGKPHVPETTRVRTRWPFTRGRHFLARRLPWLWRRLVPPPGPRLARLLERESFDVIHSLGLWPEAETVLEARRLLGDTLPAPWIYSAMGSDLYFFRRFKERLETIREVLEGCDVYLCDCRRDIRLAAELGLAGESMGIFPGGGGFPIDEMQELREDPVPSRRTIAVKGLETRYGRALVAVEALERCADRLVDHRLVFYQARPQTVEAAHRLGKRHGLDVTVLPRSPWRAVQSLFGQARVALGVSRSDGTPNALLEAMILGAFPVQTDPGGATSEWLEDGRSGLLIPDDDPAAIAAAVVRALEDDRLVDEAAEVNLRTVRERVDESVVRPRVLEIYRRVAEGFSQST